MITIRSSKPDSKATLICMEVTLNTPHNVYTISSDRALANPASFGHGLFGSISWPVSRFRIGERLLLEQQMFLPHDESTVAMSWALLGDAATAAQLVVRPFFSGCGPRFYRDLGLHVDSNDNAGRLTWLPSVHGPKLFADTNGQYHDEPVRFLDCSYNEAATPASAEDVITPGRFQFELSRRPAVLILSEEQATAPHHKHVGVFLAGLMQKNSAASANSIRRENPKFRIQQPAIT